MLPSSKHKTQLNSLYDSPIIIDRLEQKDIPFLLLLKLLDRLYLHFTFLNMWLYKSHINFARNNS